MTHQRFLSVTYALGAEQAGSIAAWEEILDKWATEHEAKEAAAEAEARRFDPTYRPTAEQAPGQAALMARGGPAPLREVKK